MKTNLTELLSYKPGAETKKMILKEVRESGKSLQEVADKFSMPPLFKMYDDGTFDYKGQRMTPKQFSIKFSHRRFVIISGRDKTTKK
jgi:hypothetical protein